LILKPPNRKITRIEHFRNETYLNLQALSHYR